MNNREKGNSMNHKRRGGVWLLLLFVCAALLCGAASAAGLELSFVLDAEGAELVDGQYVYRAESAGDTVTVRYTIRRTGSGDAYTLVAIQNEIEYDMDFFTFVEDSIVKKYGNADILKQTRVRGQEIIKAAALGGPEYAAEQPFCEFQLRIKDGASGTGWIRCSNAAASDAQYAPVTVTERNLTVSLANAPVTPQYTVRFDANGGFLASDTPASVTVDTGTQITLPSASLSGYTLAGWSDGSRTWRGTYSNDNAETVTLTAVWQRNAGGSSSRSGSGGGGSSGGSSAAATPSAAPTPTPAPTLTPGVSATPTGVPAATVTPTRPALTPSPATSPADCPKDNSCPIASFSDLDPSAWYHDGVHFCVGQGIMNGYSDGTFGPQKIVTRAQLAMILWNRAGRPETDTALTFRDVDSNGWYAGAIRWALREKLLTGYNADSFGPNDMLTRQQLAAILYRYSGSPALTGTAISNPAAALSTFADRDQVGSYALEAMAWAVNAGLIQGTTPTTLNPRGSATRAQTAVIIMRYLTGTR